METRIIPAHLVSASLQRDGWFTKKMMTVLEKQGQIEPLQVWKDGDFFRTFKNDPHGSDIVHAANFLRWDTLLVLITDRYIP